MYLSASLALVVFLVSVTLLRVVPAGAGTLAVVQSARDAVRDAGADELEKERAMRRASLALLRSALSLVLRVGLAFVAAFLSIAGLHGLGLATIDSVLDAMLAWEFIVASTVVVAALAWLVRAFRRPGRP